MDWFLYDNGLRHERVTDRQRVSNRESRMAQWNLNRGNMVCLGNRKPHKCRRTWSTKPFISGLDRMVALTYLFKIGGTRNLNSVRLAKEILDHFIQCGMTLPTEYLTSKMNVTPDLESRNNSYFSERKLAPQLFQRICQLRGTQLTRKEFQGRLSTLSWSQEEQVLTQIMN